MNDKMKRAFSQENIDAGLDEQNKQIVKRFKNLMGGQAMGTDIPQQAAPVQPGQPDLRPRPAITSDAPMRDPKTYNEMLNKIDMADRARQMQELQDAQDLAAFDDDPQSENNLRVAKLKALLGR